MFSYLYNIDQLFSELYLCYIFVLYLYVFVYIYGWYMDQSQKIKNLLKKIICLEPVIQRNRFYCVILLESVINITGFNSKRY
jgi:hypothetical protein